MSSSNSYSTSMPRSQASSNQSSRRSNSDNTAVNRERNPEDSANNTNSGTSILARLLRARTSNSSGHANTAQSSSTSMRSVQQAVASQTQPSRQSSTSSRHQSSASASRGSRTTYPPQTQHNWTSQHFMLGAGMLIVQPSTKKVVVVYESQRKYWFLPKGRKDLGETLEQTALREAYEESGYRAEFFPLHNPSQAPAPPGQRYKYDLPNTEPIYMAEIPYPSRKHNGQIFDEGGKYFVSYYVGQIGPDAVPEKGTGMADEQNYVSHLLPWKEAYNKLRGSVDGDILDYAYQVVEYSAQMEEELRAEREKLLVQGDASAQSQMQI